MRPPQWRLASPGSVAWEDVYASMAKALAKNDDEKVEEANHVVLLKMGEALGCLKELVGVMLGGKVGG